MRYAYLKNPSEIYDLSFKRVSQSADLTSYTQGMKAIIQRVIHASAEPEHVNKIDFQKNFESESKKAFCKQVPILVDCEMVKVGISKNLLPKKQSVICTLNDPQVDSLAIRLKTTRSAAAVELWKPYLKGAIVVIGNAPTALFHLLEMMSDTSLSPAVIIGLPVGFVGAAESKAALQDHPHVPAYFTLHGRHGGSAMAAAVVNALLLLTQNETRGDNA